MAAIKQTTRKGHGARALALAAVMTVGAGALVAPAQAQGLFDALFGRREVYAPQPQFYPGQSYDRYERYAPQRRAVRRAPVERAERPERQERTRVAREEPAKPKKYTPPEVLPGPLGPFLRDPTLRRGDVVATSDGLMIYRGEGGSSHQAKDFVAVASGARYVGGKATDLAALDQAIRRQRHDRPTDNRTAPTSRLASAEAPIVATDEPRETRKKGKR
ncbi:MAG TPA: hypothetical protein VIL72_13950 [Beijerinckiaceae bacterium]|jgi:hypothetical protein